MTKTLVLFIRDPLGKNSATIQVQIHLALDLGHFQKKTINQHCQVIHTCNKLGQTRHTIIGHLHLSQLSQIMRESPGYGPNLSVSHTDHQISWIQRKALILAEFLAFFTGAFWNTVAESEDLTTTLIYLQRFLGLRK